MQPQRGRRDFHHRGTPGIESPHYRQTTLGQTGPQLSHITSFLCAQFWIKEGTVNQDKLAFRVAIYDRLSHLFDVIKAVLSNFLKF